MGTDGEEFITAAAQNQFFAVDLAQYYAVIADITKWKSISEIRLVRLWCLCHDCLPSCSISQD
jgi:hypothetical protein